MAHAIHPQAAAAAWQQQQQQRLPPSMVVDGAGGAAMSHSSSGTAPHGNHYATNVAHGRPTAITLIPPSSSQPPQQQQVHAHQPVAGMPVFANKARKLSDRVLHPKIKSLVPESQAYMDLLDFENKLDTTIRRKQFDIHEALKRPLKQARKLRVFVTSTYTPPARSSSTSDPNSVNNSAIGSDTMPTVGSWDLRIEGRLVDELPARSTASDEPTSSSQTADIGENHRMQSSPPPAAQQSTSPSTAVKRKFSTYFRSLVIEVDRDLYGPDHHLVEWHRLPNTSETDGFQFKRSGDRDIRCTMLFMLNYDPPRYKLDRSLARLLGIHTANRPTVVQYLWEYIKEHKLQTLDESGHSIITWDPLMSKCFGGRTVMKFADIPRSLDELLYPPDAVVISHIIPCNPAEPKKVVCYDIEVELDDPLREKYQQFMLSSHVQEEIAQLDQKLFDTVDAINQLRANREFLLEFSNDPQQFIHKWLLSQANDLRKVSDATGNPEEERLAEFYQQDWGTEAVSRYVYNKTMEKKAELEQTLGMLRSSAAPQPAAAANAVAGVAAQSAVGGRLNIGQSYDVDGSVNMGNSQQLLLQPPPMPMSMPMPNQGLSSNVAIILQPPPLASSSSSGGGGGQYGAGGNSNKPPAISSSAAAAAAAAASSLL